MGVAVKRSFVFDVKMRAAIYNPYFETFGGGERYALSFAKVLQDAGYQVDIEWKNPKIKDALEKRFGMDLTGMDFIHDVKRGDGYDVCFWVSDGSVPTLRARRNFLHFQVPFHDVNGSSLLNKMKLFRINKVICNSYFTNGVIDAEYGVKSVVIYPPVLVDKIKSKRKENIILYVGRFSALKQSKKQEILVENFKDMVDNGLKAWKLILAGGVEVGVGDLIRKLEKLADGYPIEIVQSPDFKILKELYGRSKIFWSASGFGEDEEKNPEKVEHFGISVVEAMAGGAVPVVYNAGGHKEIVTEAENGFLWKKRSELKEITSTLIKGKLPLHKVAVNAREASKKFSFGNFSSSVKALL